MGSLNIVFLFGNGFDRNLGLATSYQEFYDYYLKQDSEHPVIQTLKKSIKTDRETWSDLELSLGAFTEEVDTQQDLDIAIIDLVRHLRTYLSGIEKKIGYSKFNRVKFLKDLSNPERVLSAKSRRDLQAFREKFQGNQHRFIHILTFNYTKIVESILGEKFTNLEISKNNNHTVKLQGIEHIHGYVDQRLVLGLNDKSQIANVDFIGSRDAVELLIKPAHNEQLGHLKDEFCLQQIATATMIYVFGSSIGETDKLWWEAVGRRIGKNCCLVIYYRAKQTDEDPEILEARKGRQIVELFLSMTDLDEQQKENARGFIYPSATKDLFKLAEIT